MEQGRQTPHVLSDEEQARIMSLPTRELTYAGSLCKGKYDAEADPPRFYLLKEEDGEWKLEGHVMRVRQNANPSPPEQPPQPAAETPEEQKTTEPGTAERATDDTPDAPAPEGTQETDAKEAAEPDKKASKPAPSGRIAELQKKVMNQTSGPAARKKADKEKKDKDKSKEKGEKGKFKLPPLPQDPKRLIISVGIVAVACIVLFLTFFGGKEQTSGPDPDPTPSSSAVTENVSGDEATPSLDTISVIQLTRDLIPGEVIRASDIQEAPISAETYNQIYLGAYQLYQWSRSESLLGLYVTTYIPQGQYLTYQNVATAYIQDPNPWRLENGTYQYVAMPIDATSKVGDLNYGNVIGMTVKKQSVNEVSSPSTTDPEEPVPSVPGIDHQTSVQQSFVVDTYVLSNIVVCDLLDKNGKSLYETYTSLIAIPTGERLTYLRDQLKKDPDWQESLLPAKAIIRLTNEQASQLGVLDDRNTTVSYSDAGWWDEDSEAKVRYAAEAQSLMQTIIEAISLNEAEAAEEAQNK